MNGWFLGAVLFMTNCNANVMNSIAKPMNSTAKPTNPIAKPMNSIAIGMNSIAKPTNSIANGTNSIAKATNSIAKTCKNNDLCKNKPQSQCMVGFGYILNYKKVKFTQKQLNCIKRCGLQNAWVKKFVKSKVAAMKWLQ